jgi:hypothetical protein
MGRYLSLGLSFDDRFALARIVEAIAASESVEIVATGAVADGSEGLLQGWAVEDYLGRFVSRPERKTPQRWTLGETDPAERDYLRSALDRVRGAELTLRDLSPHEAVDRSAGVTWIRKAALGERSLAELETWTRRARHPSLHVYVGFRVATSKPATEPWTHVFRYVLPEPSVSLADPLLLITIEQPARREGVTEVRIRSGAHVWLRARPTLGGLVGPAQSDENLERLAQLGADLASCTANRPLGAQLRLDGKTFIDEGERLHAAFRNIRELEPGFVW